ncbi:hypothetical protein D3C87_1904990 [compost metagenome]
MRGSSASSGNWLLMRPSASRTSFAATARSALVLNSSVTRLEPNCDEDDIDFRPLMRDTAPSITSVSSWSMVCAEAPV